MKNLSDRVDIPQFLSYVSSFGFSNADLDLIGQNLARSVDAHEFCRNAACMFSSAASQYLAEALANSPKGKK